MNDPLGLSSVLPWLIATLIGYYVTRVTVAVVLLQCSRGRPRLQAVALHWAPASLRPLLRRAVAGGLLGVALTGGSAFAAGPACPSPAAVPSLDRAATACPAAVAEPPPPVAAPTAEAAPAAVPQPAPAAVPEAAPVAAAGATYSVRAGDSLWGIAASRLGPGATNTEIADAWPQLWQANRSAIGDDPNRIMPGTDLTLTDDLMKGADR